MSISKINFLVEVDDFEIDFRIHFNFAIDFEVDLDFAVDIVAGLDINFGFDFGSMLMSMSKF